MDKVTLEQIIYKLNSKGAKGPCPRCGNLDFELVDKLSVVSLQETPHELQFGGRAIPVANVVCKNCGFLMQHAIFALGISLPEPEDTSNG